MSDRARHLLLLTTEPLTDPVVAWTTHTAADAPVTMLKLTSDRDTVAPPENWQVLRATDLGSADALHADIMAFLAGVPETALPGGKTLDQRFRLAGDESLWWVGPASYRHQDKAVYAALRAAWMLAKALDRSIASEVAVFTAHRDIAAVLASQCAGRDVACAFAPESAQPTGDRRTGRCKWFAATIAWLIAFPWLMVVRAIFARLKAGNPRPSAEDRRRPAIAMTATFPRHVRTGDNPPTVWYWRELADQLSQRLGDYRRHVLLHSAPTRTGPLRMVRGLYHTGWPLLKRMDGLIPIEQRHAPLWTFLVAGLRQLGAMVRYGRLEKTAEFAAMLRFCGADVTCLFVPLLRYEVARMALWASGVAAIAKSLRAMGEIRLLVVNEEFYGWGRRDIAAANRLGIPTLGVQHGAIFPGHLVYTPPAAQVANTPTPDDFAVYGPFAKEIVTTVGDYPTEHTHVVGAPRLDALVNSPPDAAAARQRLGISPETKIVLITTNFFRWFQDVARSVFDACKDRPDVVVCLKTHPNDFPLSVYETIANDVGAANVQLFDDRFDDLLAACDVLIGGFSTTVMEAILLGRTTICVNFSDEEDRYPYVADGGSLAAGNDAQMHEALAAALSGEGDAELAAGRQRFLHRHLGPSTEGQGAQTLTDLIERLVRPSDTE